jgi:hypothetical protein
MIKQQKKLSRLFKVLYDKVVQEVAEYFSILNEKGEKICKLC